ncbi:MAG: haloacid dehalogenase type II [Chloroflexi bacterium]|nr:haloacid dehalogenase type II [Chloroflexota bacterium]
MAQTDIRVATFDCYGTLVDWEGGAGGFLYQLALRQGDPHPGNGSALRERWEALQFGLLQGPYRPYKQILAESLKLWSDERGYPWDDADGDGLVRSMRSWQPFPDTRPALLQAKAQGVRLVIISNTDHDIIEHTLRHLDVPFDDVITAQDCGAYKPAQTVFEQALARVGEPPETVLHVAFGFKYDIGPAQAMGCRTAWVNRFTEAKPGPATPDYEWRDLWGLAELLGGPGPVPPHNTPGTVR